MPSRTATSFILVTALALTLSQSTSQAQATFPGRLDDYFTRVVKLTPAERQILLAGKPLAKLLDADPNVEVAVVGAIWIAAPIASYVKALSDIENFEKGGAFLATKKVSEPARLEDFAAMKLPPDDVVDLRACSVGDCALKISAESLEQMRKEIDWNRPDATAVVEQFFRRKAVDYVNAYRQGGNSRLAVYRDSQQPTYVSEEFAALIKGTAALSELLPETRRYLLEYPKVDAATKPVLSFVYWQEAEFGLKPTIRVNHVAVHQTSEFTIVTSKQLYSSHYFWTALELRALVPDPARGPGFWFVNVSRSRSDGLSGFVGRMIRGKVREGAREGSEKGLVATKQRLERK